MTTKVFVYGTLKRDYHNNRYLRDAKFLGEALTADTFDMIDVGYPVVLPQRAYPAYAVKGEVYEIDPADEQTIKALDRLEGEGRMYQRQTRTVYLKDGTILNVYMYVGIGGNDRWGWGRPATPVEAGYYDWTPRPRPGL